MYQGDRRRKTRKGRREADEGSASGIGLGPVYPNFRHRYNPKTSLKSGMGQTVFASGIVHKIKLHKTKNSFCTFASGKYKRIDFQKNLRFFSLFGGMMLEGILGYLMGAQWTPSGRMCVL